MERRQQHYPADLNAFKGLIFLLLNIGHLLKMPDAYENDYYFSGTRNQTRDFKEMPDVLEVL